MIIFYLREQVLSRWFLIGLPNLNNLWGDCRVKLIGFVFFLLIILTIRWWRLWVILRFTGWALTAFNLFTYHLQPLFLLDLIERHFFILILKKRIFAIIVVNWVLTGTILIGLFVLCLDVSPIFLEIDDASVLIFNVTAVKILDLNRSQVLTDLIGHCHEWMAWDVTHWCLLNLRG